LDIEQYSNQSRLWQGKSSAKKNMTSFREMALSIKEEDNTLSLEDTKNTALEKKIEEDSDNQFSKEEDDDHPSVGPDTNVVDELELREVSILKRMAQKGADPKMYERR